jgi:UDP:flavonoid glycosyltransferase YjiC (YdhE family)
VVQNIVDATASLSVRTLVTLGQLAPEAIRPAANTALVASASHDAVLREAAVVITHGGHGTVMRALRHGRPMLILPHGRDQNENAVRITERGAGLRLPANASAEAIQTAVRRLLEEPGFTVAAQKLGEAIANEPGDVSAIKQLETLAVQANACARCAC